MARVRLHRTLATLVVASFALKIGYCAVTTGLGQSPPSNYREYVIAATRLLDSHTLSSALLWDAGIHAPSSLIPPAYAGLVACAYSLLGVESAGATLALQVINALATSIVVLLVYCIAARFGGTNAGLIAAVIAAFNPALVGFTDFIWDTSLFALATTVSVWAAIKLSSRVYTDWRWLCYGLWLGAVALLNPALTIAYPVLVLWSLFGGLTRRRLLISRGILVTVLGWLILISPWTIRNYVHFNKLLYIRGGFMLELWLGVCPEASEDGSQVYKRRFPLTNEIEQTRFRSMGESKYFDECGASAKEMIREDPSRFVWLVGMRTVDYWLGTAIGATPPGAGIVPRRFGRAAVMAFLALETILIVFCLAISRRASGRHVGFMLAIVLSTCIVYCLTHVQVRFRAPFEPVMAVLLALLTTQIYGTLFKGRAASTGSVQR